VDAPGANQAQITVSWPSPGASAPDAPAYALAFRALAGGFASRVNLRLRERDGLTYRVEGTEDDGRSEVELAVDPARLPEALVALAAELDAARAGLTDAEVDASRRQVWAAGAAEMSTLSGLSERLWHEGQDGRAPGDTWRDLVMYRDVSTADVSAAAARWLATPRSWLVSGDGEALESALDDAGWPIDTRWSACFAVYGGGCP
jgi:predicted Zn-dependent peptidase